MKHYIEHSKEAYSDKIFISHKNQEITFSDLKGLVIQATTPASFPISLLALLASVVSIRMGIPFKSSSK